MAGDKKYGRLFTERDVVLVVQEMLDMSTISAAPTATAESLVSGALGEPEYGTALKVTFPADEPLFLLRGQDAAAVPSILDYGRRADAAGAGAVHLGSVQVAAYELQGWQAAHPDRVKVPD